MSGSRISPKKMTSTQDHPASVLLATSPIAPPRRSRWISVVSHLDPKFGGLSAVVPDLARAVEATGRSKVNLEAFCLPDEHPAPGLNVQNLWPTSRRRWILSRILDRPLREAFHRTVRDADGLHIHGLWEQSTLAAAQAARRWRKPYIVSAHGMLEPWALRNKRLKKQIYASLFERQNLEGAAWLHALTAAEAQDYRRFGLRAPIAIIPNGVRLPDPAEVSAEPFFESFPDLRGKRLLLFLGRIHFKKGLDLLVDSWSSLARRFPEAHLVLAGPDFEATRSAIEQRIQARNITDRVRFTGMLTGAQKWSAFRAAEAFVLPSYSEGLSVSTLEALGMGLPVIVTAQCNLPEVQEFNAGWQVQSEVGSLASAIEEWLTAPTDRSRAMGRRGQALVQERYTWEAVGGQMSDLYDAVLNGGTPESFRSWSAR